MFAFLENLACLFSRNTCYEISPFFAVSCLRSKISEIRMPPKILFYLNHEIKMPQKKFLDQNAKLKCRERNFKNSSVKIKCYIKYVKIFLLLFFQWKEKQALKILHRAIFIKKNFFWDWGLINPDVELGNEDDNIFKPERRFSDAFNTFVN